MLLSLALLAAPADVPERGLFRDAESHCVLTHIDGTGAVHKRARLPASCASTSAFGVSRAPDEQDGD